MPQYTCIRKAIKPNHCCTHCAGYHSDNSDIAALLCLHDAEEGGVNNWVSSIAIHNALLRRGRKDLVQVLTEGEFWLPGHNVWGSPTDKWDAAVSLRGGGDMDMPSNHVHVMSMVHHSAHTSPNLCLQGRGEDWVNQPPFLYHNKRLLANFKEGAWCLTTAFERFPITLGVCCTIHPHLLVLRIV